jgi:glycolate oxidase FAD binding subunit
MARTAYPDSFGAAASVLAAAAAEGKTVRIVGGQTKRCWGGLGVEPWLELRTTGLDRLLEHNAGDFTAVLESGMPLARAQRAFAAAGQRLALDPPLGGEERATIGGIIATGDCGPLRHRYGGPRDLVLGITVALSDGTIARSGGRVIKNVAGYDLAKLFCGSFGTLGLVLSVSVRLHPLPAASATAAAASRDPNRLAAAAGELAALPLELESLDVAWHRGEGRLLARCAGVDPARRCARAAEAMGRAGLSSVEVLEDDEQLWARQRAGQRSGELAVVTVRARPSQLAQVMAAARSCGAALVGRAALGESFLALEPEAVRGLRERLPAGASTVLTDCPPGWRTEIDVWGPPPQPAALELMRQLKARFDPAGACNRGIFVGGI